MNLATRFALLTLVYSRVTTISPITNRWGESATLSPMERRGEVTGETFPPRACK